MNKDIRLATSFKGHRKRKRLKRLLGFGAEVYLIDLWLAVAMDCPEGILAGWDEEDIADACDWEKEPKILVDALIECHWLEKNSDGEYALHDWCEHQGWACKARARSKAAGKNILLRWTLKEVKKKDIPNFRKWFDSEYDYQNGHTADTILSYYESYTNGIASVQIGNTPSPSPLPLPSPKDNTPKKKAFCAGDHFDDFWCLYDKKKDRKKCAAKFSKLKEKDITKIFETLPAYIRSTPDENYRKNPLTYLNGECWNDEIQKENEWNI